MQLQPGNVLEVPGIQRPEGSRPTERAGRNRDVQLAPSSACNFLIEICREARLNLTKIHDCVRPEQR